MLFITAWTTNLFQNLMHRGLSSLSPSPFLLVHQLLRFQSGSKINILTQEAAVKKNLMSTRWSVTLLEELQLTISRELNPARIPSFSFLYIMCECNPTFFQYVLFIWFSTRHVSHQVIIWKLIAHISFQAMLSWRVPWLHCFPWWSWYPPHVIFVELAWLFLWCEKSATWHGISEFKIRAISNVGLILLSMKLEFYI